MKTHHLSHLCVSVLVIAAIIVAGTMVTKAEAAPLLASHAIGNAGPNLPSFAVDRETLTVPFTGGVSSATTKLSYSGRITIKVSGVGQAASTNWSDAFYVYDPPPPQHSTGVYNWVLQINGQHAENFIAGGSVPAYRPRHHYRFQITAPGGQLTFGVGDTLTGDNTGSYKVIIRR